MTVIYTETLSLRNIVFLLLLFVIPPSWAKLLSETAAAEAVRKNYVGTVLKATLSANQTDVKVSILLSSGYIKKLIVYYDNSNTLVMRDEREDIDR